MSDIRDVLVDCICEKTGYPKDSIENGQALESDLGLDSIAKVELLSTVAEKLDINLEDMTEEQTDSLETAKTVADLVKFVGEMKK